MRWSKFILFFQAVVTLLIGVFFLVQVFNIEYNLGPELSKQEITQEGPKAVLEHQLRTYQTFKDRFFKASYILVTVALLEFIIIHRLLDYNPHEGVDLDT